MESSNPIYDLFEGRPLYVMFVIGGAAASFCVVFFRLLSPTENQLFVVKNRVTPLCTFTYAVSLLLASNTSIIVAIIILIVSCFILILIDVTMAVKLQEL